MELDFSPFWFMVLMLVGFFFIGWSVSSAWQMAFGELNEDTPCIPINTVFMIITCFDQVSQDTDIYVKNYKDCINRGVPSYICDMMFPPLKQQNV